MPERLPPILSSGCAAVHVKCPSCGRTGTITDPATVARIFASPKTRRRWRCDQGRGGCGHITETRPGLLVLGWISGPDPSRRDP